MIERGVAPYLLRNDDIAAMMGVLKVRVDGPGLMLDCAAGLV